MKKLKCPYCDNEDQDKFVMSHTAGYYIRGKIPTKDDEYITIYEVFYCICCKKYFLIQYSDELI